MNIWLLWLLIVVLPNTSVLSGFLAVIIGVIGLFAILFGLAWANDPSMVSEQEKAMRYWWTGTKTWLIVMPLLMFLSVITPSKEEVVYIVGGYAATNIEDVEKLPANLVGAANKFLNDYTDDDKDKDSEE